MVNIEILIDYFVNRFIIPFISSFMGFQIKNINSVMKHTSRFSKFKKALASSAIIAVIMGALLQYVQFDISLIICISVLLGTCGAEILDFVSKPSGVKLIISTIGSFVGDFGNVLKVFKEVKKAQEAEDKKKTDKLPDKEEEGEEDENQDK